MDFVAGPGVHHSDTEWYRADGQRRHAAKDTVLYAVYLWDRTLADGNVPLWLMVREAAHLSGDPYLHDLYLRYFNTYMVHAGLAPERLMLESSAGAAVDFSALAGQPDYVQFFYYALSCDKTFGQTPGVVRGRSAARCLPMAAATLLQPPCATHQLMGYMFMRQRRCEDPRQVDAQIARLQDRIVAELHWDPRVIDPYVQRVLMLYWTDAAGRVQPVWLQRVLAAQQPDGGWADQQEIARTKSGRWLGFGGYDQRFLSLHPAPSSFHTTAQGLLLMSMVAYGRGASHGTAP